MKSVILKAIHSSEALVILYNHYNYCISNLFFINLTASCDPNPEFPADGTLRMFQGSTEGDSRTYGCNEGYRPNIFPTTPRCNAMGEWQPLPSSLICEPEDGQLDYNCTIRSSLKCEPDDAHFHKV